MRLSILVLIVLAPLVASPIQANAIEGPGRFCGYSPIIDLLPGETVTTLQGGIHSGSFRWKGSFGTLIVRGIGWASRPKGKMVKALGAGPARFAERRTRTGYEVAIWNGAHGAAYFSSPARITAAQLRAIDRVTLFEEGEEPTGCKLRTSVAWE